MKKIICLTIIAVLIISYGAVCQNEGADKNIYALGSSNYQRAATASEEQYDKKLREQYKESVNKGDYDQAAQILKKYLGEKSFFPAYDEMKSSSQGITLEDWKQHLFTESSFRELDQNSDNFLDRKELETHPFMGSTKKYTQDLASAYKLCKDIPDYKKLINDLKRKGYDLKEETYYIPIKNSNPDPENAGTKTYVNFDHGEWKIEQVPLGVYTHRTLKDFLAAESMTPVWFCLILVCLLAGGTILIPKLVR